MALRISHIDFTRTTTRFRGWNQVVEQFELVGCQVAGISSHVALSVLCIFTIRSLRRVSFYNLLFKHPLMATHQFGSQVKQGKSFVAGCWV